MYNRATTKQALVTTLCTHSKLIMTILLSPLVGEHECCLNRILTGNYTSAEESTAMIRLVGTFVVTKELLRKCFNSDHLGTMLQLFQERDSNMYTAHTANYYRPNLNGPADDVNEQMHKLGRSLSSVQTITIPSAWLLRYSGSLVCEGLLLHLHSISPHQSKCMDYYRG